MKKFNILITGGFGLLGQALIKLLNKKKYKVIILDKNKKALKKININLKKNKIIVGNFLNKKQIQEILKKNNIKVVFHLGAVTQVNTGLKFPEKTYKNNVTGTINILEEIRKVNKNILFLYASSDKAYGECNISYKESANMNAIFPYDLSKMTSDLICQSYSKVYKLKVGILRCGNLFGPSDFNLNRIIPDVMRSIFFKKKIVLRSDGKMTRDYLHVDDAANAYWLLMNEMSKKRGNLWIYNVGSKTNLTVLNLVKKILIIAKIKNFKIEIKKTARNELKYQHLNFKKISNELNWKPKKKFNPSLKDTFNWYYKNRKYLKN